MSTKIWTRNTQPGTALAKVQEAISNPEAAVIPKPPSDVSDSAIAS
jgi:hypothetical protein